MWLRKVLLLGSIFGLGAPLSAAPFTLGIYGVNNPADIRTVKKAGFTGIQTYQQDPATLSQLAQEAKKQGLRVVFYPNQVIGSSYEKEAQNWPVLAWYLVDEPDVARWSRAQVLEAYNIAKSSFPQHLTALVIGQGKTETPFYDLPDILMVDWYPVPHLPLYSFGDQLAWARHAMAAHGAQDNPLWGVVQAFDWKEFEQHRPLEKRMGRFPTEDEMRFMSYHGIINGVNGLFFFIFTTRGVPLPQAQPAWWKRVACVGKELARFRPVLEKGTPAAVPAPVARPLLAKTWQYKKKFYTVLLNASDQPRPLPAEFAQKKYKSLFGHPKKAQLAPYQVLVLRSR